MVRIGGVSPREEATVGFVVIIDSALEAVNLFLC